MLVMPPGNQTIFFLRYREFGPGRFDVGVGPSLRQTTPEQIHAADRDKVVPPVDATGAQPQLSKDDSDCRPKAWPYDTGLPSGLPELPVLPGQTPSRIAGGLPGVPPTLASRVALWWRSYDTPSVDPSDNQPAAKPGTADIIGKNVNLLA